MQLTKLEIKGFKSFGDKVVINFDKGITGIVGPNGCGKSNVVDAIRWVLGEQKVKSLRSEKMENIIFNGTNKRKPTQLAEVSLSFKNTKNLLPTEYTSVTITRRYYRSGESEYQLNGVTCRLKDISNLFMDTGIASNSYAIIELGMVDNILNDKDNSRRSLFEEAAGISKFKVRKKETLKKLSDTDTDLERVEDLLFEIDKNLKSLERQAKQAEKYFQIKEDYKAYSIELAKKNVHQESIRLKDIKKSLEQHTDTKLSLKKQVTEREALIEQSKTDLISNEKLLSTRQKTLNEHTHKIRSYESEKKIKNERLRYLNDRSDQLMETLELDRKSSERSEFSIASLSKEKETSEKILHEISYKLQELKDSYETEKIKNQEFKLQEEELTRQYNAKKEEVYQLNKSIEIMQIQLASMKQELEKTATDSSSHNENIQSFDQRLLEVGKERDAKTEEHEYLKSKQEELKSRTDHAQKTVEVIKEELQHVNRKLDASQNEFNLTKSLVDNLEGFPEAIKFLKKNTKWSKNAPLLSDILTCPDEYRVTIENYLEPYMNYYVVENEQEAFDGVHMLSDAAKGKANFFVLDRFEHFKPSATEILENSIPATEVVEYESKYKKLIGFVLDNVYITSFEKTSLVDQKSTTLLTKNGKIINRPFSITGGSVGLFEGKRIGRAKNLEKLADTIKKLKSKLSEVKQNLEEKSSDLERLKEQTFKPQIEQVQDELSKVNEEYISLKTKQEQISELLSKNAMRKDEVLESISNLSEELEILLPKQQSEQLTLEELTNRMEELKVESVSLNEQLSSKSSAFNQENILYHQQENKVASINQEISHKQANLDATKERLEKSQSELKNTEKEVKELIAKSDVNDDLLISMYEEKEAIEQAVNEAEKAYYSQREVIDNIDKEARELHRLKEQTDMAIMDLQNELNETKLQLTGIKERLSVEFQINLDQLLIQEDPEENNNNPLALLSEEELRDEVDKMKSRLDKIGPINPMAMEAYQEIKERFDFITTQKEDLTKAKESLISTIGEIDLAARGTFMESFEKIKENFIRVFRSLFTEQDQCDLRLTNPEDPLESSIDIIAKPKGKRPLTINQLSGGEKTLTATSLLFAIYLLKPAPFCIFDEVDAPLDDANIDKFNNIIRDFSNESQFIIVTHNKRTMSATDIIYGVTMIEQGVTRVVPVDIKELA